MKTKFKVTVYIPCRSYGHYVAQAISSVMSQTLREWELILIDNASEDHTRRIFSEFQAKFPDRIKVHSTKTPWVLQACANYALQHARGEYVIRLDSDDYLDENALLVLSHYLDQHPNVGLVYPNYFLIASDGAPLGVENHRKINSDTEFLDLPAHGACTMIRKRLLKNIGGYDERYSAQDGHELWIKMLQKSHVKLANVSTPLFYYRQHDTSLSKNTRKISSMRRKIKKQLLEKTRGQVNPKIAAIIPAKNSYAGMPNLALKPLGRKPLIDYTLAQAASAKIFDRIFVSTDDPRVVRHCSKWPGIKASLRPKKLSASTVEFSQVVHDAVVRLENDEGYYPDIIVLLSINTPLRKKRHIQEALDTLLIYNADSVISVTEASGVYYQHGRDGLAPLNPHLYKQVRLEREALVYDNGAVKAIWRDCVKDQNILGKKIGHIVMPPEESLIVTNRFSHHVAKSVLDQA